MGSTDLNSPDFTAIEFLNQAFQEEPSVDEVDPLVKKLKLKVRKTDSEMVDAIREQSQTGSQVQDDLAKGKEAIQDLRARVTDVERKADQSEEMIEEICKDIKKLDKAKQNLTMTITTLRRLGMLITAVDQLERMASNRNYRDCANLLEAVNQLSSSFEGYEDVAKVAELNGKYNSTRRMLRSNILQDFSNFGKEEMSEEQCSMLGDACLVMDALGKGARDELISDVCNKELTAYNQIFSVDTAKLDKIERRYAWFKRELRSKERAWNIFPKEWHVTETLCSQFCKLTRAHVAELLDSMQEPDVHVILQALHKTLEFEKELDERFSGEGTSASALAEFTNSDGAPVPADEATTIKEKYRASAKQQNDEEAPVESKEEPEQGRKPTQFHGMISSCFEPHLGSYVELEDKQLHETLDNIMKEETWHVDITSETQVLGSASQVFLQLKKVFNRCRSLTHGKALFDVHSTFKGVLKQYSSRLKAKLPSEGKGLDKDDRVMCLIINTAEYCLETTGPLSESLQKTLLEPYNEQVDFSDVEDEFSSLLSSALSTLEANLEARMEPDLSTMTKMNWGAIENVGDQSEYVDQCSKVLSDAIQTIGPLISSNHFRFFIEKFAGNFCPKLYANIFRCKRFNETGAQQLLLDIHALKTALLQVPSMGSLNAAPTSYTRLVTREIGKAESLLKVILSPSDGLGDTFRALLPEATLSEFRQVLELKGIKKAEQTALAEEFLQREGQSSEASHSTQATGSKPGEEANSGGPTSPGGPELNLRMTSHYVGSKQGNAQASNVAAPFEQARSGFKTAMRNLSMRFGADKEAGEKASQR